MTTMPRTAARWVPRLRPQSPAQTAPIVRHGPRPRAPDAQVSVERQDQAGGMLPAGIVRVGRQQDQRHPGAGKVHERTKCQSMEALGNQTGVGPFVPKALQQLVSGEATPNRDHLTGFNECWEKLALVLRVAEADRDPNRRDGLSDWQTEG
jgi:hypothetical protein